MSTQQIAPDVQSAQGISARLKRKLDKHLAAKERKHGGTRINAGQKPQWAKHLTRNTAAVVLKQVSAKEMWLELLGHKDAKFRFEVLRYLTDRLEGRPFVAENPNAKPAVNVLNQDNRLQIAIQQLVPAKQSKKKKTKGVIEASSEAKLLTEASGDVSNVVEGVAQVVDSTQDGVK